MKLRLNTQIEQDESGQTIDVNFGSFYKFFILSVLFTYAILFVIGFVIGLVI